MLSHGPFILVVLVVIGVWRRWRVGHVRLGRVQCMSATSSPTGTCISCGHGCNSGRTYSSTGHEGRLIEMRRPGTRPSLVTSCQWVEELRCSTIYKMSMQVMLDAALAQLLMLGGKNHMSQGSALIDDLLHNMARWNLHRHCHRRSTVL